MQGAIVTGHITKYTNYNRKFNDEIDGDPCVLVELLRLALFNFFQTKMVFILLAISGPTDAPILLLASI